MKIKLHFSLFAFCLTLAACVGSSSAFAQDGSYSVEVPAVYEVEGERDKATYTTPTEMDAQSAHKIHIPSAKDTATTRIQAHRATKANSENAKQATKPTSNQGDDSILSFNFLYYLFEKYKMQDIVD